ncbi:PQQ-binding-like beta-propeller repeat protein [Candidatus Binatia bacterium]|nr:PQQ-binding-like beta-propeller repeat protein [Candidatus Binatia bacterium]
MTHSRPTRHLERFVVVLLALASACSDAPRASAPSGVPPEVAQYADDWALPGRDYLNSRATRDSSIDKSTIAQLAVAWRVDLSGRGAYGNISTTPLIAGDTVYLQDLSSRVSALDRETGAVRWQATQPLSLFGPNGVALGWGKVFANDGTDGIVALDATTGATLWSRKLTVTATDGVDIQPVAYGDLVFASTVPVSGEGPYRGGDRGVLYALRQDTGEVAWSFDTVDSDDLWGNPEINSGGGAWYPPAIDEARGRIYWGIANPAPFAGVPGYPNGSSRPGPNLYTDSLLSLDVGSGVLDWYRQATPHDIFDHDLALSLLVDVRAGSGVRRIAVATGKAGFVIGHDADTGDVLWTTSVGVHENDQLTALGGRTQVLPGLFGGVLTPPAAADGVVYVAVVNSPAIYEPELSIGLGGAFGTMNGQAVAIDAATGTILWDVPLPGDPFGGMTVVNDLVITGVYQGTVLALDRATGETVWTWQAPGGINGWPAIADDLMLWPIGASNPSTLVALRLPR